LDQNNIQKIHYTSSRTTLLIVIRKDSPLPCYDFPKWPFFQHNGPQKFCMYASYPLIT